MSEPSDDKVPEGPEPLLDRLLADRAEARRMAPLLREFDERRMLALIADCREELEFHDGGFLADCGATVERTEAGFDFCIGSLRCPVEAGAGAAILIDGMPFVPDPQFYTLRTYHQLRARLETWARAARRL